MTIRPLSSELQKKAEKELNEVSRRTEEDLQQIKEWLQKQPHIKVRLDDQWLLGFLRGCKFSLQRTKEKLDYFYTMRSLLPEFFMDRDPLSPDIQAILKAGAIMVLPNTADPAGPRLVLYRWEVCDPEKMTFVNIMKVLFMTFDILINEDDNAAVTGMQLWAEYKKFQANYILQFTPGVMKKCVLCLQSAYPLRIKGIYCTNIPSVFEVIFNMCKQFMSEKLLSRMHIYSESNFSNVYKEFSQSILPKEYNGTGDSMDELAAQWKKKMESYRDWFLEDSKYRSDEKLRVGEPVTSAELFGVEGTFRKLAID